MSSLSSKSIIFYLYQFCWHVLSSFFPTILLSEVRKFKCLLIPCKPTRISKLFHVNKVNLTGLFLQTETLPSQTFIFYNLIYCNYLFSATLKLMSVSVYQYTPPLYHNLYINIIVSNAFVSILFSLETIRI